MPGQLHATDNNDNTEKMILLKKKSRYAQYFLHFLNFLLALCNVPIIQFQGINLLY